MCWYIGQNLGRPSPDHGLEVESGLLSGSRILTLDGELPVEHLTPGDRIVTRDVGMARLKEIAIARAIIAPVRFTAGSLGHTRPEADTLVAPKTRIHIRDWRAKAIYSARTANVPADELIDGEFIRPESPREMSLVRLIFDEPRIIYAEGLEILAE